MPLTFVVLNLEKLYTIYRVRETKMYYKKDGYR